MPIRRSPVRWSLLQRAFLLTGFLAILVHLTGLPSASAQSFTSLGTLPAHPEGISTALGVSDDGSVVIGHSSSGSFENEAPREAFRWTSDGMTGLGSFRADYTSTAYAVSGDGSTVVGQAQWNIGNTAFRWTSGDGLKRLVLGVMTNGGAKGVSANGAVVVGNAISSGTRVAFRWTETGVSLLPAIRTGARTEANAVSSDGSVVVGFSDNQITRWQDGAVTALGPGFAQGVSADGSIVVGYNIDEGRQQAFIWTAANGLAPLAGFPDGSTRANDVSDDGRIIVGVAGTNDSPSAAAVWTSDGTVRLLKDILEDQGLDLTGWTLQSANSVSADGRVIVGFGNDPNGNGKAWRAEILPIAVEEIVVNSAADEPKDPISQTSNVCDVDREEPGNQCTLRAAIELANAREGGTITFDIEGDPFIIPKMRSQGEKLELLPTIEHPTTLDGTTQEGGFVLVSFHGRTSFVNTSGKLVGLTLGPNAGGSTIRGIVVNGFGGAGIRIEMGADGCTIEGNRIGTDYSGTVAIGGGGSSCKLVPMGPGSVACLDAVYGAGLHVLSSNNRIVDNVIAGNSHATTNYYWGSVQVLLDETAHGNVLERNLIGYGADGNLLLTPLGETLSYEDWEGCSERVCWAPVGVNVFGHGNTIGGSPEAANRIGGHWVDVWIRGESAIIGGGDSWPRTVPASRDNVVSHNRIGTEQPVLVTTTVAGGFDGGISLHGQNNRAIHNTITTTRAALGVWGPNEAYDNTITGWMEPVAPLDTRSRGQDGRGAIVVGGDNPIVRDNNVDSGAWGIVLSVEGSTATVVDNEVEGAHGALLVPTLNTGTSKRFEATVIEGNTFRAPGLMAYGLAFADGQQIRVAGNTIEAGRVGIALPNNSFSEEFQQILITQNTVSAPIGIDLGQDGVSRNDVSDVDQGPNILLNFPVPHQVTRTDRIVRVEGVLEGAFAGTTTVEVFGNAQCGRPTAYGFPHGAGEHYLGNVEVTPGLGDLGEPSFEYIGGGFEPEHKYVTLTASRTDLGVTSEFSRCIRAADINDVAEADVAPGELGNVLNAIDVRLGVEDGNETARKSASSRVAHGGGRVFATRYNAMPDSSAIVGSSATSPDGSLVAPTAVASRYWHLAETGLTTVAEGETPARFRVCIAPTDAVTEAAYGSVLLMQRSEATETDGQWIPLDTSLENHEGAPYLCTGGLEGLGVFSFGGPQDALPSAIQEPDGEVPNQISLGQNYPNPFNPQTVIPYTLNTAGSVKIEIFDMLGRHVQTLVDATMPAGRHLVTFDAGRISSGMYLYQIEAGSQLITKKMMLIR